MVFLTEFTNRFFASGKLCTVHIVDQENSSGGQAFIEQRKCSGSWSIEIRVQRYKTKSFICNIGKGIRKPSFVDHSTCRIRHNMKNRVNISRRKITCFWHGTDYRRLSIVISFSEKPSKVSKRWILRSGKAALIREENSPRKTPSSATFPGISN